MRHLIVFLIVAGMGISIVSGDEDEVFPGQRSISIALRVSGGLEGKIFLSDKANSWHGKHMLSDMTKHTPEENILTANDFSLKEGEVRYSRAHMDRMMTENLVRVFCEPNLWFHHARPHTRETRLKILRDNDILAVHGTGNISKTTAISHANIYRPKDPYWGSESFGFKVSEYKEVKEYFQGGHAIMVNFATRKPATFQQFLNLVPHPKNEKEFRRLRGNLRKEYDEKSIGEYIRHPFGVSFGDLKEYGFSVFIERRTIPAGNISVYPGTSTASGRVAGFAFYLFQLWDTTEEVIAVMQKTATDIGDPGVDEDFGWGLINAHHPIIVDRAMEKVAENLSFCLMEDATLEEATTAAKEEGFDLFYRIESGRKELGFTYDNGNARFVSAVGSTQNPLGLRSKFLGKKRSKTFQAGFRYSLTEKFSIISSYGRGGHDDIVANQGTFGLGYRIFSDAGGLSLYVGRRIVWGALGIPGYAVVDVARTPFTLQMTEIRTSLHWSF